MTKVLLLHLLSLATVLLTTCLSYAQDVSDDKRHSRVLGTNIATSSSNNSGYEQGLKIDQQVGRDTTVFLEAIKIQRTFTDKSTLKDTGFQGGVTTKLSSKSYVDVATSYSSISNFLPQWSLELHPHLALESGGELGLRMKYAAYSEVKTGQLIPSYLHSFTDDLFLSLQVHSTFTDHAIMAYQAQVFWRPFPRHSFRLTGATGRVLEEPEIEGRFDSLSLSYAFHPVKALSIQPLVRQYRGSIRNEDAFGATLEVTLW